MRKLTDFARYALLLGVASSPATAPRVLAQADAAAASIDEIIVVGSRRQDRSAADSPVPVDVIGGEEFLNQGHTDMDMLLANLIPSFNVGQEPISDAATLIRPANLRGLSSDASLVLINGKRRHRAAAIAFLGGGLSDGAQGPDLSVIPGIALQRVEVLRDGASAQYGSDAIAGVINFVLKDDPHGGSIETRWSEYYEGDGAAFNLAGNLGLPLTDSGFANLSFEYRQAEPTSRSVQRGDAQDLIDAGNTAVRTPVAQVWGAPEVHDDFKLFGNAGIDLGNNEAYLFGNWAQRTVEGGFFFRNPNTRDGVFKGLIPDTLLVADLTDDLSGQCPTVPVRDHVPDAAALAAVAANPDCFAFNERFPGGFTPLFGGDVYDASIAFGVRGNAESGWLEGWYYDLSAVAGRSNLQFFINNTINPQLATRQTEIPTSYFPGAYTETDRVVNLDLSKPIEMDAFHSPLYLAAGFEFRDETFKIESGDPNSWHIDPNLAAQGFGIGSNGFPGFKPEDAGESTRGSRSIWIDLETDWTANLLVGVAVRAEDYDDFGSTLDGKAAARLSLAPEFALRGSFSTGFRAPTVGQSSVRNVTTQFTGGVLADEATLPPTHPISLLKGGKVLQPEESVNLTLGSAFRVGEVDVTVDYYRIEIEDRIALTSTLLLTAADVEALLAAGVADASSLTGIRFFTNDFDTTTQGVDLVASWPTSLFGGGTNFTFVGNWNDTRVDAFNPDIIDAAVRVRQLEEARPASRFSLTASHRRGDWRWLGRLRYYGEFVEVHLSASDLIFTGEPRWFVDAEAAYSMAGGLTVVLGAQNLLDEYPTANPFATVVGAAYPESSPYGFNGGRYYLRLAWDFD